ncbi:glutaredoxin domain-containing protein [Actinoplanes sp. NEAU-A12]|uniref:Glutaredoxin domain-containing protein n=1 Tax=Actinoplanes sandaracinus TaxID=3045177 RepID=A0ABT6WP63_9ACTN|nr:glutaredoxin domain-containing protein [Actinoplanes sandaracinus]MDI6101509.1 glutaredoxin domain-containing protein [Actinoplanes sandaracinus]
MLRRWSAAILTALCGVLVAATKISDGAPGSAALLLALFLGLGFVLSPLAFPRSSPADADLATTTAPDSTADDRPIVYWRPGCVFCLRLRVRLGADAARLRWVDIWQDPAAAAAVREITGGDETVPTVVIGGHGHVNPDPSWLRDQIVPAAQS